MKKNFIVKCILITLCFMIVGCSKNDSVTEIVEEPEKVDLDNQLASNENEHSDIDDSEVKIESEEEIFEEHVSEMTEPVETEVEKEPTSEPEPASEPVPTPAPAPVPEPAHVPTPEPVPEPTPVPTPEPATDTIGSTIPLIGFEIPRDLGNSTENHVMLSQEIADLWQAIYPNGWLRTEGDMLLFTPAGKPEPEPEPELCDTEKYGYKVGDSSIFTDDDGSSQVLTYIGNNRWSDENGCTKYMGIIHLDGTFGVWWME